jgi:nucleoside-diphosphate-sugar epimerase
MKIFVSGGAGFIGGHLCESLLSDGHTVYAMDNFSTGSPENIKHLRGNDRFHFTEADIISSEKLPEIIRAGDSVLVKASHSMAFEDIVSVLEKM